MFLCFLPIVFLYHSINKPHTTPGSPIRSDEELALEKSAFNFFMVVNCLLSTQRVYYKHIFLNCQRTILAILHLLEFVLDFLSCLFKPTEGTVNVYVTHGLCLFSICKLKMERRSRYVTLPW